MGSGCPMPPVFFVLVVLLLIAVGLWLGLRTARSVGRRHAARSRRLGTRGEAEGLRLLKRSGCRVIETESTRRGSLEVDGRRLVYHVRVDALVLYRGRRYVAEFKHGGLASRPTRRGTRRQLLEYALLFGVDGVLLVDAAAQRVRCIRFPLLAATPASGAPQVRPARLRSASP